MGLSDNSLYVSKEKLQEITGKDHLTQILIKTNENVNDTKIADEIEDKYGEDLLTFTTEEQVQMMSQITSILDLVTYAISALAIIIGGIGIINTMIMAVYERTKEIDDDNWRNPGIDHLVSNCWNNRGNSHK